MSAAAREADSAQLVRLADLGEHAGEVARFDRGAMPGGEQVAGVDPR